MSLVNEKEECLLIETLKSYIPNVEELLNPAVEESAYDIISSKPDIIKDGNYREGWIPTVSLRRFIIIC